MMEGGYQREVVLVNSNGDREQTISLRILDDGISLQNAAGQVILS